MRKLTRLQKILIVILVFLGLCGICGTTYGVYTTITKVKRVVSTQGGEGELFSSNYLHLKSTSLVDSQDFLTNQSVQYVDDNPAVYLSICNYAQENIARHNSKTISYTLTITLCDLSGNPIVSSGTYSGISGATILASAYTCDEVAFSSEGVFTKSNETLSGASLSRNVYVIAFPQDYSSIVAFKVLASTDANTKTYSNYTLEGLLQMLKIVKPEVANWNGKLVESSSDEADSTKLYGFTYEISGTGSGTFRLIWDNTKVSISKFSLSSMELTESDIHTLEDTTKSYVDIEVSSQSYRVQFFRTIMPETETWTDVAGYFSYSFTASE